MAALFKADLGVDAVLVPAGRGIFDVTVNGDLVYSKYETGTFPDAAQLVKTVGQKYPR